MSTHKHNNQEDNYSWLRKLIWPYNWEETKIILPMTLMLALSLFMYTSVRIIKDSLILNAPCSGSIIFGFLKSFFVFPASIVLAFYMSILNKKVDHKKVYYWIAFPFLIFFIIFTFILYPNISYFHWSEEYMKNLIILYPSWQSYIVICGNWVFSLFYIIAELSGNTFITFLFWKFANSIFNHHESKKYYAIFSSYSNVGLISAGLIQIFYGETLFSVCILIILALSLKIGIYYYLVNYSKIEWHETKEQEKVKLGFFQGLKFVAKSKYLFYLGAMVLCYGISINLCEQTWKGLVAQYCKQIGISVNSFFGYFFIGTGVATFILGSLLKNILKNYSWKFSALITPVILIGTSLIFCLSLLLNQGYFGYWGVGIFSLLILVLIGGIQNILGKSTKYALFDPVTQMAYKPLSSHEKTTGKAAIDVVFGRLGKSAGGFFQSIVLMILPLITGQISTQKDLVPVIFIMTIIIGIVWIYSSSKLSYLYEEKINELEENSNNESGGK